MSERYDALRNANELKFSREQGFFDRSKGIRLLIISLFAIILFLFLHFREEHVEMLELDSFAPSYVVAQVDFNFFDEKATIINRQEAVRDLGKIYSIPEKEIRQKQHDLERQLLQSQEWRKDVPDVSYEDMWRIAEQIVKTLQQIRFTDPRTVQKMKDVNLPTELVLVYTPLKGSEPIKLPEHIWQIINSKAFPAKNNPLAEKYIQGYFQAYSWILVEDIPSEDYLRKKVQSKVPDKYTEVSSGNRIIDQGEKVNSRHIAMLQAMKKELGVSRNLWHPQTIFGSALLTIIFIAICGFWLAVNFPQILQSNRKLFLLTTIIAMTLGFSKVMELILINSRSNIIDLFRYPLFVPFAAILIGSLLSHHVATFFAAVLTVVLTLALALEWHGFMVMNFLAAIVAILSIRSLVRRKEIFIVCAKAWLCCVLVIISMHLYQNTMWQMGLLSDLISSAIFMLLTAVLVVGLLPLLESGFRIMTDVSLMEYMDPNNDLLRRLSIEAPGTYQHSILVGNLAEAAAMAIDANGLFCRAATMYHDIGKIATPQYFTENQQGGMNIHQLLTPKESAQVIIAHVSEGVALARKAGLPEQFIDIIKEHHGTTLVYFFYRKQLQACSDDESVVDEKDFRYAGPKPRSKESAIIMIADSIEAASRSLEELNEESLTALANRIVREKAEDGQFDGCLLTFEELAIVQKVLIKNLVAFSHSRVKYPVRNHKSEDLSS